jgi:hypothetical protein
MEPEGSLPHSQVPATCPYPESAQSNPYPTSYFLKIRLNIILPSTPGFPQSSLSLSFSHQNPVHNSPLPHTRYMPRQSDSFRFHHPHSSGWEYRSWSSSFWRFLHSPVTSSLLCSNILLKALFSNTLSTFFPQCQRPRFTPIQNYRQRRCSLENIKMWRIGKLA